MKDLSDLNEDAWALDIVPAEGQRSLTAPSTIDDLLREYTKFLLDTTDAVQAGSMTQSDAVAAMRSQSEKLQRIFYGQDKAFLGQPTWNKPQALGSFLCKVIDLGGDPDDAVSRLMRAYWNELAPCIAAFEAGSMNEAMFRDGVIEELLERYRSYLMGAPYQADKE